MVVTPVFMLDGLAEGYLGELCREVVETRTPGMSVRLFFGPGW
jgi:hypothetical protein